MQFTVSTAAFLALISHALAQTSGFDAITKPTSGEVLNAGSTYQVTWDYNSQYDGTVSITLLEGKTATTLEVGDTVASGLDNSAGSYSWTVGSDLGDDATYGLKITLDSDPSTFQYSFPFTIEASAEGSSGSSSSAAISSSVAASSAAPSSSAAAEPSTISLASTSSSVSAAATTVAATSAAESATTDSAVTSGTPAAATGVTKPASTGTATKTTLTSVAVATSTGSSTGSGSGSSPSAVVTAGAGKVLAGTFAAMGGLAVALFAL